MSNVCRNSVVIGLASLLLAPCLAAADKSPQFTAAQIAFFEKDVSPILKARCVKCHGGEEKIKGDFRLTSRTAVLRGGEMGPAVSLEKPDESQLLKAINYQELEMPPTGKLPAAEIEILTRWVKAGLPWTPGQEKVEPKPPAGGIKVDDAARSYWAYRPVVRPQAPRVKNVAWVRSPIDAFLLARLEAAGLSPAPPADPVALVRRLYYDLTGLPPKPDEVDAFVADPTPAAYERLIDRLLESPQYGEKWGRHWLDLVRYAESNGYERDNPKPQAWRYRDYVIDAFNRDKPYDQFLREQLAGDELDEVTVETLTATGYYRLGIWDDEPADRLLAQFDVLDGVLSTTSQVTLGMTVGCARCHDHKKDPLPQRDYYRLLAFFRDVTDMNGANVRRITSADDQRALAQQQREKQIREGQLYAEIYQLEQQFKTELAKRTGEPVDNLPASDLVELTYRFYRDTWESLPDFDSLKPEAAGVIAHNLFTLEPASRQEAIGLVFEGKLRVPRDGEYSFDLTATAGARLVVGDQAVIHEPQRGKHQARGTIKLATGLVPIRLEYFNSAQKPQLIVSWSGPGFEKRLLTQETHGSDGPMLVADSRQQGQTWCYKLAPPSADWMRPEFTAEGWPEGLGGFGRKGTPGAVVGTDWDSSDIWLRKKFRLDAVPPYLSLSLHHDDDAEVYLNGELVHQAKGYWTEYRQVPLDAKASRLLKTGDNVLAVHCRQTGGGQFIDVGLVATRGKIEVAELIRMDNIWEPARKQRYLELTRQLDASRKAKPPELGTEIMCVTESGAAETHVLLRGSPHLVGDKVLPGYPEVLSADPLAAAQPAKVANRPGATSSGKRRALAEWLTSKSNPLAARVFANRLWQFHFGRGIVPTPNDFGQLGEQPTHPELLDWLATELMDGDWRVKRMHKLLLLSNAYQMSSQAHADGLEKDPGNRLFWRFNMRRLTAEELRDSILAVSGQLNLKPGGPSIYPRIPKEVLAGQSVPGRNWEKSTPDEAARRSVYVHVKRSLLVPILGDHDAADTDSSCAVRYTTTVPTQSLGMLNGEFANEQAVALSQRLKKEAPGDAAERVRRAIRLVTLRQPTDAEVQQDVAFLRACETKHGLSADAALVQYCLLMLNTNEFVYLD